MKYLILMLVGYYIYVNFFPQKRVESQKPDLQKEKKNSSNEEYVDYEEVE